ncbi:sensor histidine kinase [Cohnella sp. GCM10020058]|uniref:cache domain-containing sensor histidine kinase n=1 Tax=Cohnella sp. GCM10020058 TaxID=3317330 RepID=UPI0036449290
MLRNTIFSKLLLSFLLLSTIPLMLSGWYVFHRSEQTLNERLSRETVNMLDQKLKTLSLFIADMRRMGDAISSSPAVASYLTASDSTGQRQLPALDRLLSANGAIRPENVGMTIVGNRGSVHAYGYAPRQNATLPAEFAALSAEANSSAPYTISPMHVRSYSADEPGQPVFSFVRRIGGTTAAAGGTLIIDFKIDVLQDLLKNIFLLGDIYNDYASGVIITDRNGQILYPYAAGPFGASDYERLKAHYALIQRYDKTTDWNFTAYFLKSELYKPIHGVRKAALTITLVSIAFCLAASLLISNFISKPISQLRQLMRKVGRGDFDVHYKGRSRDEIGALGNGFNTMVGRIQDLVGQVYEEQGHKRRAEIAAMQSQINPHFLYNTLESINSIARRTGQREISRMIVLLGKLLRMSIGTFEDMILLGSEVDYAAHYLEIHKLRMKEGFDYALEFEQGMLELYTIKWILQPVVENAVIHGLDPRRRGGSIRVNGWIEDDEIRISVSDQGVGMRPEDVSRLNFDLEHRALDMTKHQGKVGLFNVQSRIRLHYGTPYSIQADSVWGEGMTVTFRLPRRESSN